MSVQARSQPRGLRTVVLGCHEKPQRCFAFGAAQASGMLEKIGDVTLVIQQMNAGYVTSQGWGNWVTLVQIPDLAEAVR